MVENWKFDPPPRARRGIPFPIPSPRGVRLTAAEVCAQASSLLTSAKAEFVRQALVAPATVAVVLETLYSGGGDADNSSKGEAGTAKEVRERVAAACRLNSARVMNAVFSEADASDVVR